MPEPILNNLIGAQKKVLAFDPVYYLPLSDAPGSTSFANLAATDPVVAGVKTGNVTFSLQSWNGLFNSAILLDGQTSYVSVNPDSTPALMPMLANATRIFSFSISNRYPIDVKVPLMEMMNSDSKLSIFAENRLIKLTYSNVIEGETQSASYDSDNIISDLYTTWHTLYLVTASNGDGTSSVKIYLDGIDILGSITLTQPDNAPTSIIFGASHGLTVEADKVNFRRLLLSEICFFDTAFSAQKINTFEFADVPFFPVGTNDIVNGGTKTNSFTAEVNTFYTISRDESSPEVIIITPPTENLKVGDRFYVVQYTMGAPTLVGQPEVYSTFALEDGIISSPTYDGNQWVNVYPGYTPMNFRWQYYSGLYYNRGNVVTDNGNFYIYTNYYPQVDTSLSDTDYWEPIGAVRQLAGPSSWTAGQLMRYGGGLYMANDDIEIIDEPFPDNTGNADLIYIGPTAAASNPKLTVSLAYGIAISSTTDTPLEAVLQLAETSNAYIKQAGFEGDITIDGTIGGADGATGTLVFVPAAGKKYKATIIGNVYSTTAGGTGVKLVASTGLPMVATANVSAEEDSPIVGSRIIDGDNGNYTLVSFQPSTSPVSAVTSYGFLLEFTQLN